MYCMGLPRRGRRFGVWSGLLIAQTRLLDNVFDNFTGARLFGRVLQPPRDSGARLFGQARLYGIIRYHGGQVECGEGR